MFQHTLQHKVSFAGIGVHSGEMAHITIEPAPDDYGIQFCRTDVEPHVNIPAFVDYVVATDFCTVIGRSGVNVMTIEHLLSALVGMGVDNARILISGPEVPIMDGSSSSFVFLLEASGLKQQKKPKKVIQLHYPVRVEKDERFIEVSPSSCFHISIQQELVLNGQKRVLEYNYDDRPHAYVCHISRARTYGWLSQYELLLKNKMSQGACLNNALLFTDNGPVNESGLRYADEPCRHKVLDAIGDLALAGTKIIGHVRGHNTGHAMNIELVDKLMKDKDAWSYVDYEALSA